MNNYAHTHLSQPEAGLENKFSFVRMVSKRARHLLAGGVPIGVSDSLNKSRVAQDEIRHEQSTLAGTFAVVV